MTNATPLIPSTFSPFTRRLIALGGFALAALQPPLYVVLYFATPRLYFHLIHDQPLATILGWLGTVLVIVGAYLWPTTILKRVAMGLLFLGLLGCWNAACYLVLSFFFSATFF